MIEPLAFFLRHPVAICMESYPDRFWPKTERAAGIMDPSYLLTATGQQTSFGPPYYVHVDLDALVRGGVRFGPQ